MPEGDSLHRAARRLQVLVGQHVEVETPHPRAAVKGLAERLDGRRLDGVEAVGKNLLLRFEGGLVVRSHLRMKGRWRLERRGALRTGKPWLVLRGEEFEAVLWNGAELELVGARGTPRLGPDILGEPPDFETMFVRLRTVQEREIGDALLDQRLTAGIGNIFKSEACFAAKVDPWRPLSQLGDEELRTVLEHARTQMLEAAKTGGRHRFAVYKHRGPCGRCRGTVRHRGQGDANRTTWWCERCQP